MSENAHLHDKTFRSVYEEVKDDLGEVHPLPAAGSRLLPALVWMAVASLFIVLVHGLRSDAHALGGLSTWGLSVLGLAVAGIVAYWALREAVPAAGIGPLWVFAFAAAAPLMQLCLASVSHAASPAPSTQASAGIAALHCFSRLCLLGVPMLLLIFKMQRDGLPTRPLVAGLLAGSAAALTAEMVWRLHCSISDPFHTFAGHTSAIAVSLVAAPLLMTWLARRPLAK